MQMFTYTSYLIRFISFIIIIISIGNNSTTTLLIGMKWKEEKNQKKALDGSDWYHWYDNKEYWSIVDFWPFLLIFNTWSFSITDTPSFILFYLSKSNST